MISVFGPPMTPRGLILPLPARSKMSMRDIRWLPRGIVSCATAITLFCGSTASVPSFVELREVAFNYAGGRDVAVPFSRIDQDAVAVNDQNLVVNRIDIEAVGATEHCLRSLNDANRSFFAI